MTKEPAVSDTPTTPMRAVSAAVTKEKNSALLAICGILLSSLGVMSGVVWSSMSNTVAAQGLAINVNVHALADQQSRVAVLESQAKQTEHTLERVEQLLSVLITQRAGVTAHAP